MDHDGDCNIEKKTEEIRQCVNNLLAMIDQLKKFAGGDKDLLLKIIELRQGSQENLVGVSHQPIIPAIDSSKAVLDLVFCNHKDEYEYEYIHQLGSLLTEISSELLNLPPENSRIPLETREKLQLNIAILLQLIFLNC
jgi:hypothetical protein